MRFWMALLTCVVLVSCADIAPVGTTEPAATVAEAGSGYVFDDETPPAPEAEAEPEKDDGPQRLEMKPEAEQPAAVIPEKPAPVASGASPEARLACQRQKGALSKTPAGFYVCVQQTGQGRKACTAASDCKGACLARSGTCAPFTPLIGCNDVITASGGMATVCID